MLSELLQEYWFSKKEAKVYLTNLQFGQDTASALARRMWENRITIYSVLKSLCLRGMANETLKNGVRYYSVISPKELLNIHEHKIKKLKKSLPNFQQIIHTYARKPSFLWYMGAQKIEQLFDTIFFCKGEILQVGGEVLGVDSQYFLWHQKYQIQRIKSKIASRILIHQQDNSELLFPSSILKKKYTQFVTLDFPVAFELSNFFLCEENTCVFVFEMQGDVWAMVIKNEKLYIMMKGIFELLWERFR